MEWNRNKFRWVEETDFKSVAHKCATDETYIVRAVSVWHDDLLCGYLITCDSFGIRSFHGFKFVTGGLEFQMPMTRKYIEEEKLEYSMFHTNKTKAVLRILGFKEVYSKDGHTLSRKI